MLAARWGRIVMISSTAGQVGATSLGPYCASKHGVIGLMRSVAHDVAPFGITCNAVLPGWVRTEMAERDAERRAGELGVDVETVWAERAAEYPVGTDRRGGRDRRRRRLSRRRRGERGQRRGDHRCARESLVTRADPACRTQRGGAGAAADPGQRGVPVQLRGQHVERRPRCPPARAAARRPIPRRAVDRRRRCRRMPAGRPTGRRRAAARRAGPPPPPRRRGSARGTSASARRSATARARRRRSSGARGRRR